MNGLSSVEAADIGLRARERVLSGHTAWHRAGELENLLRADQLMEAAR
jgi:hypothetical protein